MGRRQSGQGEPWPFLSCLDRLARLVTCRTAVNRGLIGSRCKGGGFGARTRRSVAPWDRMRQQGGMKASTAWSPAAGLNVVSVERGDHAWTVTVDGGLPPACPRCGALSNSRHSTYSRTLRHLSAQGAPVLVRARLGRWRCRNLKCDRRIFAERLPGLAAPLSRQTSRLAEIVRLLGHSAGGRPSERLMRRLGMPISDTTILASLKQPAKVPSENCAGAAVRVAGVDDWAWRKSSHYGTIIVDLERHQVVDVLADRSAATTASWFRQHPNVEVVSRDRAGLYAEAAREGAPQARQVADRFHLLQNFRETVERQLGRYEAPVPEACVNPDDSQAKLPWRRRLPTLHISACCWSADGRRA
jgi:transposase